MELLSLKLFDRFDVLVEGQWIADRAKGFYERFIVPLEEQGLRYREAYKRYHDDTLWSRAVYHLRVGLRAFNHSWVFGALIQIYRPGYYLEPHLDCRGDNWVLWILLKPAKKGGDLYLEGSALLNLPRLKIFNGGKVRHGTTPVEEGTRWLLMLQGGRDA